METVKLNHTKGRSYIDVIEFLNDNFNSYKTNRGYNYTIVYLFDMDSALYLSMKWDN